ncbi:MAG: class I SAM-dependent methyltransferase [Anaerolineae bacterium]
METAPDVWYAFLRLFFRLLYNELAWSYDLVAWLVSGGKWISWGRATLSHLKGKRVLELGHGPGHLLVALARRGVAPVGLDLSPNMGRQAQRRLGRADVTVPLVRAQAQALPFSSGGFDSVVAALPAEFIVDPRTVAEVTRTLAPGGRLIVAGGPRFEGEGLVSSLLTWLYQVTGQNPPSSDLVASWLGGSVLSHRILWEPVGNTSVMLVVADKSSQ